MTHESHDDKYEGFAFPAMGRAMTAESLRKFADANLDILLPLFKWVRGRSAEYDYDALRTMYFLFATMLMQEGSRVALVKGEFDELDDEGSPWS